MESTYSALRSPQVHAWLKPVRLHFRPGPMNGLLEATVPQLLETFQRKGHFLQDQPDDRTDAILTTTSFGQPLSWRESLLFAGRRKFNLNHLPTIITLLPIRPDQLEHELEKLEAALGKDTPDPGDFRYPGLADSAYRVLYEQGRRGGPLMALERVIQAQSKSIRSLLVVGEDRPERAYHFDLVGAHPVSMADGPQPFYEDIVNRIVTTLSTREITDHRPVGDPIPARVWSGLETPNHMRKAASELGKRRFFTEMVVIANLVNVPAISETVANQYSEGCFATWDPEIQALVATVTGSARPVDKGSIGEADLAVIVGVREDGRGARVRHVEGKQNDPPSSEAVEMMGMDSGLPRVQLGDAWESSVQVPVIRSKLHGHRGVSAFDPARVEHVRLDAPYYHYPVSCATEAQAQAIIQAFGRSEALQDPADPRQVVFTVLPGHGIVIAEKWIPGKTPFQVMWEMMDEGTLQIDQHVPQGQLWYESGPEGMKHLQEPPK